MATHIPKSDRFDMAIIGGGSAGLTAATVAGRLGARVLLVDKERLGGDCLYYGCVPSKALIRCAKVAHLMRTAARFGLRPSEPPAPEVDIRAVLQFVWDAVEELKAHDSPEALAEHGVQTRFGGARFLSERRIAVGDGVVEADRIILAVGSHAAAPPIEGLEEVGFIDHVKIFHLQQMVRRLVVIGGGPIGIEMGQSMARLGSRVTILQSGPSILPNDDPELTSMLGEILSDEMEIRLNARVIRVETAGDMKRVVYRVGDEEHSVEGDEILVAVGRKPSLDGLDLEAGGIEYTDRGVTVDPYLRTSNRRVWAAGDCTGSPQFTHLAEAHARIATRNALFRWRKKMDSQGCPWTTFSDPELAHVGLTEPSARSQGLDIQVYRFPYSRLDRAVTEGEARGLAKVVCTGRGRILGASLLGPGAGEALGELVLAMREKIPIDRLASTIHVYPTMSRIVRRLGDQRFLGQGLGKTTMRLFGSFKGRLA